MFPLSSQKTPENTIYIPVRKLSMHHDLETETLVFLGMRPLQGTYPEEKGSETSVQSGCRGTVPDATQGETARPTHAAGREEVRCCSEKTAKRSTAHPK